MINRANIYPMPQRVNETAMTAEEWESVYYKKLYRKIHKERLKVVIQKIVGLLFLLAYSWMKSVFQGEEGLFIIFLFGLGLVWLDKPLERIK